MPVAGFDLTVATYDALKDRRAAYLARCTVPLDGMWENAFLPAAKLWTISLAGRDIGYCAMNAERELLGFDVSEPEHAGDAFAHCLSELELSGAYVSTAEPAYLSLCADHQSGVGVNALMYGDDGLPGAPPAFPDGMAFGELVQADFDTAVAFGVETLGADRGWLEGYYAERLALGELFGLWQGDALVATGELRVSPNQPGVADVGMMVSPAHRKQGIATGVLQQLRLDGRARGLRLICSTESGNVPAQKAIIRAGFASEHRILHMKF